MLNLSLNPDSPQPLVDQIVAGVRARIEDRLLRPGMRLPPIRHFADSHGISRFTVVEAYDRLVAQGLLRSRRGAGFYVEARSLAPAAAEPVAGQVARAFDNAGVLHQSLEDSPHRLKVGVGWLPPEWHDQEGVRRQLRALSRRPDVKVTCYGTPLGYAPLREQVRLKLADLGIVTQAGQVMLSHGATQGLDLLIRLLLKPGDCVFVDDPGYWNLFANLRLHGVQLVGVPWGQDGPDPLALEALLAEHRPRAFFTHSVLQNPTACNLSPANAFRILQLAEKHDFLVVEDDTYCDFHAGGATRLATLDQLNRVIYVGSFSKTLSANLRVGFVAGRPDLMAALADVKIVSCVSTSEVAEQLVYEMLTAGHYRKFIDRTHGRLREASAKALRLLERVGMEVYAEPVGGMFIWARAPGLEDSARLASQAATADIMLAPGHIFRPQLQASPWIRFNVGYTQDPRLERFLGEHLAKA